VAPAPVPWPDRAVPQTAASIMRKLGFAAFSELVRYAVRNHIVQP
jgi:hypothetical protein